MIKVMFVCYGNICRSVMAEYLFRYKCDKLGCSDDFFAASSATSTEEIGNPPHYGTVNILKRFGIDCSNKRATRFEKSDYESFDYILCMESFNVSSLNRIIGKDDCHKVFRLLDFTSKPRNIDDPWYTHDFETTYKEISEGIEAFLSFIKKGKKE